MLDMFIHVLLCILHVIIVYYQDPHQEIISSDKTGCKQLPADHLNVSVNKLADQDMYNNL